MKHSIRVLLAAVLLFSAFTAGWAHAAEQDIKVFIEGEEVVFDPGPVIVNNRTLVPFRQLFEALGLDVEWQQSTRTVVGKGGGVDIRLRLGDTTAVVNGVETELAVAPVSIDGRTYVPLRFVGEATGRQVKWDGANRIITIGPAPGKTSAEEDFDFEAFYREFIAASDREDIDGFLAFYHEDSPYLAQEGDFRGYLEELFAKYDLVSELELFEVVDVSETEAVLHTVESGYNTNDKFYVGSRTEQLQRFVKDDAGQWKFFAFQILALQYLVPEERLVPLEGLDDELESALLDVLIANVEATIAEDLDGWTKSSMNCWSPWPVKTN